MRGSALKTVPSQPYSELDRKFPQSTVKPILPATRTMRAKRAVNRTLATVLWVLLTYRTIPCLDSMAERVSLKGAQTMKCKL